MKPNKITGLQAFARYMVDVALDGGDVDGGTIQEMANQYGLLTKREMTGPCREPEEGYCACAFEAGFPVECYQVTDVLLAKSAPAEVAQGEVVAYSQCACGDEYAANSYGAGFMAANNGVCENCDTYTAPPSPDAELVELLSWLRGSINCTPANDADKCGAWISTKHPMIQRIDAKLASLNPRT